jgi:exonuclease III
VQIATWNVNSIRARAPRVIPFLERTQVDVLAMQEIKCKPEQFPLAQFEEIGYKVGFSDLHRDFVPQGYTYWDYKDLRFPRNEGMRIDFVLSSPALSERISAGSIERDERKGELPSDHVPVISEISN